MAAHGPTRYEIRVAGVLDSRWAAWFDGLQLSGQGEETVICGLLPDQSALHGLLTKVRDLGLCLISVRLCDKLAAAAPERAARGKESVMSVYRVTEIIGTSSTSWEDAAAEAIRTAAGTLRDLRVAEVVKQDIHLDEGGAITYRTKLQLSFKYESDH
jgi:hypothetical protein